MEWRQFLWVSDRLNPGKLYPDTDDHRLALSRSGISRAYYAAHNEARLYVKNKEGLWLDHGLLWDHLRDKEDPNESEAGSLGHELRGYRNQADYDAGLTARHLLQTHQLTLNSAHEICRLLGRPFPRYQKPTPEPAAAPKK